MRQRDQIRPLSSTGWAAAERPQTTWANIHDLAETRRFESPRMLFYEPEPHGFWPAKNCVAFFKISLSSLRMRFSRRSLSFSCARLKSSAETTSVSRYAVIHLFSVDMPIPRSPATCLRVNQLVRAIRTASRRNSSVRFSPIVTLLCCSKCYQRSGIKPRQVHFGPVVGFGTYAGRKNIGS